MKSASKNRSNGKKPVKKQVTVKLKFNIWTIVFAVLLIMFFVPPLLSMFGFSGVQTKIDLSDALNDIKSEKIQKVVIEKDNLVLTYQDGSTKLTTKEEG